MNDINLYALYWLFEWGNWGGGGGGPVYVYLPVYHNLVGLSYPVGSGERLYVVMRIPVGVVYYNCVS